MTWALAVHGGAGAIGQLTDAQAAERDAGLHEALDAGGAVLAAGGTALDAAEAAVCSLELCPYFNASRGSVLTSAGVVEMDAAVMTSDGRAGAVAGVRRVRHPVRLARAVMEHTPHVLLIDPEDLAVERGLALEDPEWFVTELRAQQQRTAQLQLDHGTVGAVARDVRGGLAAATSTGGMTNKRPGRVGDSPIIGAGTWADARCAVSATGWGEHFMRHVVGARVGHLMELAGLDLRSAAQRALAELPDGVGGLIAVSADDLALPFTSRGMYRGWLDASGSRGVAWH